MTQQELDALPELSRMRQETRLINGTQVRVLSAAPLPILWNTDDEPMMVLDTQGRGWRVGWHKGTQYKIHER